MRVFRYYQDIPLELQGGVVAIGNFDGVHRGHRAVIGEAGQFARAGGVPLAVLSFEPHPRVLFQPDQPPFRLTPFRAKAIQLANLNVDLFLALHFDKEFAAKTAEEFIQDVLLDGLKAKHVITGYDFVFGKGRGGDAGLLRRTAGEAGFGFTQVPALRQPEPALRQPEDAKGDIYSSSTIRKHLQEGRPVEAAQQLGHWWEIDARVQHGDKRGRQIGFPTANLALDEYIRPAFGVYAVRVAVLADGAEDHGQGKQTLEWRDGVANLGRRPTIRDGEQELLEVHLLDFEGDLYGAHLRVSIVDFIRPEQKFDGLEALTAQIAKDSLRAREILSADDRAADLFQD
ncbi:MAG: bifunctional riboflavin kinase/FAD synthetase [Alphaproteobacteria bacterium]|nr:bifunctional riboflavin kinase/FAD synthetase [Alphaproteobacteria bacterium]